MKRQLRLSPGVAARGGESRRSRLVVWHRVARSSHPYREIVGWWLLSRLVVVVGAAILSAIGTRIGYFGSSVLENPLTVLASWDGGWYAMVARHGYLLIPGRQSDPAFFPLYPVLLRAGDTVDVGARHSGVLLSNLALPFALCTLYALGKRVVAEPIAHRAAVYAAVFPMGFVFSMAYPQSLALLAIAGAALLAYEERFLAAALVAAAATLLRPEGLLVALPIAVVVARRWKSLDSATKGRGVAAALAAPVALASYPLYLGWALHDVNAWSQAESAWGRRLGPTGVFRTFWELPSALSHNPGLGRDVAALVIYAVVLAAASRAGVPRVWILTGALTLAVPLISGALESEARFGLLAPPLYWGLAAMGSTRTRDRLLKGGSLCLLALATLSLPYVFP